MVQPREALQIDITRFSATSKVKSVPHRYVKIMATSAFQYVAARLLHRYRSANIGVSRGVVCASSSDGTSRGAWDVRRSPYRPVRKADYYRSKEKYHDSMEDKESFKRRRAHHNDLYRRRPRVGEYKNFGDDYSDDKEILQTDDDDDDEFGVYRRNERPRHHQFDSPGDRRRSRDRRESETELSPEQIVVRSALSSAENDLVYGISPVLYALESQRRQKFFNLFVQLKDVDGASSPGPVRKSDNSIAFGKIQRLANDVGIPIVTVSKGELNLLSKNRPHQGVVLQAAQLSFRTLSVLPPIQSEDLNGSEKRPHQCYIVLDEVTDPQNAGAIMRSAYFLGASGVIVCTRNSCGLTPVVSKASAGSMEIMEILGVSSMPRFLRAASRDGWRVIGMARGNDAVQAKSLELDQPTLVVLGSEGCGLRTMVKQACDTIVEIGGRGRPDGVDSLNVSVAGAVALYQLLG